ncbi:MAG: gliding motility-associated C-terminal domain-containing protein [Flavobacteriales bacterium]|nr:gliding motility-associated C-terminal domain-containing protein [Flavobacteriales bacterium]
MRFKHVLVFLILLIPGGLARVHAQAKLNITSTLPSNIDVCGEEVNCEVDIRNISTGTLTGLNATLTFPAGLYYVKGSISGSGITELNVSDSLKPSFSLPNLSLAQSAVLKFNLKANCQISALLNSGKLVTMLVNASYSGGVVNYTSSPFSISQPSLQIKSVSNRFMQADLYEIFVREITLINSGKGRLSEARFRQINQNGLRVLSVVGGSVIKSGDTVYSVFNSSHFKNIGNKDGWLDQNEEVVIRDTLKTLSCDRLNSAYSATWGCDGQTCQTVNSSGNVTIKTKVPNLVITPSSSLTRCLGSSNTFNESLRIVNAGDDTARYVQIEVFQSAGTGHYIYMMSKILENTLTYRLGKSGTKKSITPSSTVNTYNLGAYSCLGTDPVGWVSLALPDINPGDTVYVDWLTSSCCSPSCNFAFYVNRWNFSGNYFDRCGNVSPIIERRGSNGYYSRITLSSFGPSDAVRNDTVLLNYELDNVSLIPQTRYSKFEFDFVKPAGLEHSLNTADFYLVDIYGRNWKPAQFRVKGDTIRATFFGTTPITLNRSELKVRVRVDCSKLKGSGKGLAYELLVRYAADTTCSDYCNYPMACTSDKISLHCGSNCNGGLQFSDFDVYRTSLGEPDNDNDGVADASGSLDFDKIKRELVMYGDTLLTVFKGKFKDLSSTTSWRFLYASSYIPYGTYLDVADVRVRVFRNNNLLYDCNGLKSTYTNSGVNRTFYFDAGIPALISAKCPLFSGFTFTRRDSVELIVKYHVSKNPGNFERNIDLVNSFYTSTTANPSASQRYQCDTFAGKFRLIGYYFTNYGANIFSTNSCSPVLVTQNYYLSVGACCGNYAGGNIFPFEYRSWAKLDEITLHVPPGFRPIHADVREYRTSGTGFTSNIFLDTIKPYSISGDSIRYKIGDKYEDSNGVIPLSDDGFYGVFRAWLQPTCNLGSSTQLIQYDFDYTKLNYLGTGNEMIPSGASSDQLVYDAPIISMAVAQDFVLAKSDTIEWELRLNNTSGTSSGSNLWISSMYNPNVELVEIVDKVSGARYSADSAVFHLGDLLRSGYRDLLIRAIFQDCDADSIKILVGYNCDGYPSSRNNLYCAAFEKTLSYLPQNTRLDSEIEDSNTVANLCEDRWYSVKISNTGEARVFGLYLDLTLRSGMKLGDTAWVFAPNGKDSFLITDPVTIGGGRVRWNIYKGDSALSKNGLPGINGVNALNVKFKLSTDCDFVASSFFLSRPGGYLKCGNAVLSAFEVGNPIDIAGIKKPYFSSVLMKVNPLEVCNYKDSIEIKFINLGPDTTGVTDRIQLLLPSGFSIDTTAITLLHGKPQSVQFTPNNGGLKVDWIIGEGLVPGDSLHFRTRLALDLGSVECGLTEMLIQALVLQPALCVKTNTWCDINVATSSQQLIDSIKKADYRLSYLDAKGQPVGNVEKINLNYSIRNRGIGKSGIELLQILIVDDVNGNGRYDAGELVLYRDSIFDAIPYLSTLNRAIQFNTSGLQSCRLLIATDSSNCSCSFRNVAIPPVSIENAGRDTTVCSGEKVLIGLGAIPGSIYRWESNPGIAKRDSARTLFGWDHLGRGDSTIRLVLRTTKGSCVAFDTVAITVRPAIIVDLRDTVPVCRGANAFIGQTARGGSGTLSYSWTPTTDLTSPTASRTWAKPSNSTTYTVQISDPKGCKKLDSSFVQILELPIISINVKDTCADSLVQFFNQSQSFNGSFYAFYWEIGPSIVTTDEDPVISLATPGTYSIRFNVTDSMGCSASTTDSVQIFPNPSNALILNDICAGDSVHFVADTSGGLTNTWYIKGAAQNPPAFHLRFTAADTVDVALRSTNLFGCSALSRDTLNVYGTPQIAASGMDVCLGDSTVLLSNALADDRDSIVRSRWYVDGISYSGMDTLRLQFADTGSHPIAFAVRTLAGCSDSLTFPYRVHELPRARIRAIDACENGLLRFIDLSTIGSGSISGRSWNMGTGYLSGNDTLDVAAPSVETQRVDLAVISDKGCTDTTQGAGFVHSTSRYGITLSGNCANEVIELRSAPGDPDSIARLRWLFHNGDSVIGTLADHVYANPGSYAVQIRLTMNSGCEKDSTIYIDIDPLPNALINAYLPCGDDSVVAVNASTTPSGLLNSSGWFVNNAPRGNADSLKYKASTPGATQNIRLEIQNSYGCADTASIDIDAGVPNQPGFRVSNACEGEPVQVVNEMVLGSDPISEVRYEMGDGVQIVDPDSFPYAYSVAGNYLIRQTLTNSKGCTVNTSHTASVHDLPVAGFSIFPDKTDILNSAIQINDQSIGADSIYYGLSNGTFYLVPDFEVSFDDSGTYVIRQWVYNRFNCSDSISRTVRVNFRIAIWVPNAFTPNGDTKNGIFRPYGDGIVSFDLRIFNRWGEQIFQSTPEVQGWDGVNAMPGVYMYRLEVTDYEGKPHYFNGVVHLLR